MPVMPRWFQAIPIAPPDDTSADETEGAPYYVRPVPPTWSTADRNFFYQAADFILTNLVDGGWDVGAADVTGALNQWGGDFHRVNGRFPDGHDLLSDPMPWILAQRNVLRTDLLPASYTVSTPEGTVYYRNTPETGPLPVAVTPQALGLDPELTSREQSFALQGQAATGQPTSPDFTVTESGRLIPSLQPADTLPGLSADYVAEIINTAALVQQSSGGGRAEVVYDKDELAEAIRDRWRTILREEPTDPYRLADEFIAAANDFASQGGSKDFDTWMLNRMRAEPKYETLYAHMDPSQSELEYLNSFVGQVNQFGLSPRVANQQVVRGLTSGPAPAAFAESVARSRDVQAIGTGGMSRQFASLLQQLGPLQRA